VETRKEALQERRLVLERNVSSLWENIPILRAPPAPYSFINWDFVTYYFLAGS
jgi:hypothetical protein